MSDTTITADHVKTVPSPRSPGLPSVSGSIDILASRDSFEHMQRVAKVFCTSDLIPAHLKKNNGADALLALQIAKRMNEDPVFVMQNIYFVSGKAGWSASYMIARANRSGVFKGPIRWKTAGQGEDLVVTARGRLAEIEGEDVEVSVSWKMAKAEGWLKNPKYNTMPEHMLRWRSATMLIRLYCPEVMMGIPTEDELTDQRFAGTLIDVTGNGSATVAESVSSILRSDDQQSDPPTIDGAAAELHEKNWTVNAVGEPAIIKGIKDLLSIAETEADVQAIVTANTDKTAKMSAMKRDDLDRTAEARLAEIKAAA